jgi:nicotinamidase-related amidase
MAITSIGPDFGKSTLLIIDMQNDFLHTDGWLAHRAKALPDGAPTI